MPICGNRSLQSRNSQALLYYSAHTSDTITKYQSRFPNPNFTLSPSRMTLWRSHPGLVSIHRVPRPSHGRKGCRLPRLRIRRRQRVGALLPWRQIQVHHNYDSGGDDEKLSPSVICGWPPSSYSSASRHCHCTVREQIAQWAINSGALHSLCGYLNMLKYSKN